MCVYRPDPDRASHWGVLQEHLWFLEAKSQTHAPTSQKGRSLNSLRCWALHDVQWSINPARKSKSIPVCPGALSFICLCGLTETDMNMKSVKIKSIFPHMKKTVSSDVCSCFCCSTYTRCRNSSLSHITQNTLLTLVQSSPALYTGLDTISSHLVVWPNTMGLLVRSPWTVLHVPAQYKQIRSLLINTFNLDCLRMEKGNTSISVKWPFGRDCNRTSAVRMSLYRQKMAAWMSNLRSH